MSLLHQEFSTPNGFNISPENTQQHENIQQYTKTTENTWKITFDGNEHKTQALEEEPIMEKRGKMGKLGKRGREELLDPTVEDEWRR